jgi:hypothetical protein
MHYATDTFLWVENLRVLQRAKKEGIHCDLPNNYEMDILNNCLDQCLKNKYFDVATNILTEYNSVSEPEQKKKFNH